MSMCKEYKEFWQGRYRYKECDFCGEKKEARGIGYAEVDVMSQCWDCHAAATYPVSLQAILFREVQEMLMEDDRDECDGRHGASCSRCCP
jgi:hypothetical protein